MERSPTRGSTSFPIDGDRRALGPPSFADLGPDRVYLSTSHAMAESSAGTLLAYTQGSVASVATLERDRSRAAGDASAASGRISDAWVAATDQAVALVAGGTPSGATAERGRRRATRRRERATAAGDDGGAGDGGRRRRATTPGRPGSSSGTTAERPHAERVDAPLQPRRRSEPTGAPSLGASIGPATQFPGNWGAVAALAGRAFVASDGQTSDKPVAYRAFDLGSGAPSVVGGYSPLGSGPVLYADVAFHQDHLFFAVERPGGITLDAFDNATTTPAFLREISLGGDPRIPTIADVRDGRVAVLATDTRVIVAWTTQEVLGPDDATGGYVVFACTTP